MAPSLARGGYGRRLGFARHGENLPDPRERDGGLAQIGEDAAHLANRPEHEAEIGEEREEHAHCELAVGDPMRPDNQREPDLADGDEIADRPIPRHQPQEMQVLVAVARVGRGELGPLEILARKCPDDADAREIFLDDRGERTLGLGDFLEDMLHLAEINIGVEHDRHHEREGHKGHRHAE